MDDAEDDVLAHLAFPKEHWPQLHSTNPLERLNGEIKRRTDVVAIFPNEGAIVRLVGAMLLEQNDEWAASRARYMSLEKLAAISDDPQARPRRIAAAPEGRPEPASSSGHDRHSYTTSRDAICSSC